MPLELTFDIDDRQFRRAAQQFPQRLGQNLRKGVQKFATTAVREMTKERLGVPDNRVAVPELGGLGIRPATSLGLVRRSGGLVRSLVTTTTGNTVAALRTVIGFINPFAARIARVHELGTIGKGGKLPDIYPKRGPYLVVPVRGLGAALSAAVSRYVRLRKVSISPRLGFHAKMQADVKGGKLDREVQSAVVATIQGKVL